MALNTFDQKTIDSSGAFLIGELERLDQTLHMPLVQFTWTRDIDLRSDVSISDEFTSFTNSTFAAPGLLNTGKNFIGANSNAIQGIALDISKTKSPMTIWAMELGYTIIELMRAQAVGRPIDSQKYDGMKLKHEMDVDEMVYLGDEYLGVTGLLNGADVAVEAQGGAEGPWSGKDPDEILTDVNKLLYSTWQATGWKFAPSRLLLPPSVYADLVTRKISELGFISVLKYVEDNNISLNQNGTKLEILPCKWCTSAGTGGSTRAVAYTKKSDLVRFPYVPMASTPIQYKGLEYLTYYYAGVGVIEKVYPSTLRYMDKI